MPTCQKGHDSQAADYCDVCGSPIAGAVLTGFAGDITAAPPAASPSAGDPRPLIDSDRTCPAGHNQPTGRFCEVCGHDFLVASLGGGSSETAESGSSTGDTAAGASSGSVAAPAKPEAGSADPSSAAGEESTSTASTPPTLMLIATADRAYFETVQAMGGEDADSLTFPAYSPQRRFVLRGDQMLIGRRSRSRGIEPDIDLSGQPEDPGVSHAHAMLIAQPNGTWALVDVGSANGTFLNGGTEPITEHVPVPLSEGDRIHLGAWTTLTVTAAPPASAQPSAG